MWKIAINLCIAVLFAVIAVPAQERFAKPVDEAGKDPSFLAFRTKLIAAAERKDLKYVISIMDPDISLSFGGHSGVKGFHELWTNKDEFWSEFLTVIKNGGKYEPADGESGEIFIAPYSFSNWPEDLDAFDYMLVFGENVNLRETPALDGNVITKLSYNVVKITDNKLIEGKEQADWYRIETLGGKKGWVKAEFIRSPIDYRAGFEKQRGTWKMTYFIAGD
jgi:hypothetical protein